MAQFISDIYSIRVNGAGNFFYCMIGQEMSGLKIVEIVHHRDLLMEYGLNRYSVYAEEANNGEIFQWKVFDNCQVEITRTK